MNRTIHLLFTTVACLIGTSSFATEVCPAYIESTTQQISVPDGWELVKPTSIKLYLQGVAFSFGHPENMVIIKYGKIEKVGENSKEYYSFSGKEKGDYWVRCAYLGTSYTLTRKIHFSSCTTTTSPLGYVQDINCAP